MKKNIITLTSLALLASACCCKQEKCNTQDHDITLIGHKATLSYPGLTANVKYLNDSTIYWKTTDEKLIDKQKDTKAFFLRSGWFCKRTP
ncbi:hypothetical protein [Prevotella histicola]|uniref:hypothetical protein n=1 Tax=Prevotella histicola TaxID=470565 RepID=UPI00352F6AF2